MCIMGRMRCMCACIESYARQACSSCCPKGDVVMVLSLVLV